MADYKMLAEMGVPMPPPENPIMDEDLKLVERLRARVSNPTLMEEAVAAITRLHAEIEALKSDAATASETLRLLYASQGKDRNTIDGLVKERDGARMLNDMLIAASRTLEGE